MLLEEFGDPEPISGMLLSCPHCSDTVASEKLDFHLRLALRCFPFACRLCPAIFVSFEDAERHFRFRFSPHNQKTLQVSESIDEGKEAQIEKFLRKAQETQRQDSQSIENFDEDGESSSLLPSESGLEDTRGGLEEEESMEHVQVQIEIENAADDVDEVSLPEPLGPDSPIPPDSSVQVEDLQLQEESNDADQRRIFKCIECRLDLADEEITSHLERHHGGYQTCRLCGKLNRDISAARKHASGCHSSSHPRDETFAPASTARLKERLIRKRWTTLELPGNLVCNLCRAPLQSDQAENHIRDKHFNARSCGICGKIVTIASSCIRHLGKKHGEYGAGAKDLVRVPEMDALVKQWILPRLEPSKRSSSSSNSAKANEPRNLASLPGGSRHRVRLCKLCNEYVKHGEVPTGRHILREHDPLPGDKVLECSICGSDERSFPILEKHYKFVHGMKRPPEDFIQKRASVREAIEASFLPVEHRARRKNKRNQVPCELYQMPLSKNPRSLAYHAYSVHYDEPVHSCKICGSSVQPQGRFMEVHFSSKHPGKPLQFHDRTRELKPIIKALIKKCLSYLEE